ncbi:hypothetical protein [Secundilactobacillus collinoides]|uniref:Uncharacterized protein n=2 Tax=Secundilactobacillus collinoides TaxID=33960 RepID=A0A0R2BBN6_SECCO|nr:hypothetical protein [Secundilactobacillus collinoides]KRM76577.1 hypothetical protein FC82_GL001265 [Secundilactobacillus collinoides DSM 20515 = JCM 1123]KZL42644.1 hypothetical protein TY91_04090 [Secundilactobacillus collinoides]
MTLKDTLTYNEQLAVAKSLLKQPVSADDAAAHYANLQDLKQELDQELSRLDIRLHPVASKGLVNAPHYEDFGETQADTAENDHSNVMMGFLTK